MKSITTKRQSQKKTERSIFCIVLMWKRKKRWSKKSKRWNVETTAANATVTIIKTQLQMKSKNTPKKREKKNQSE